MHRSSVLHQLRQLLPTDRAIPIEEAKTIAERQANRLLHLLGITKPSVNVAKLIDLPRIAVSVKSPLPVSGLTYWNRTHWEINIRKADSSTRRRFTLAHEFKHIIDHPYLDVLYPGLAADKRLAKQVETICDHFAACLLMPALWVKREWDRGVRETKTLARIFQVSPAAMAIRLAALGLSGEKPGDPTPDRESIHGYFRNLPEPAPVMAGVCPYMKFAAAEQS